ncbi:MAG: VOC family protein [Rhizobacter sp.]|nr:VOC family protein [Rhizobacter sp.]
MNAAGAAPSATPSPRRGFELLGIDHIVLRVRDVLAMQRFYIDVLGATLDRVQAQIGLVQVRAGRSLIDLVPVDSVIGREGGAAPGAQGHNVDHFCLRVEPFDGPALVAYLQTHGIDAGSPARRYGADGTTLSVYLRDPEGNRVELKGPPGQT